MTVLRIPPAIIALELPVDAAGQAIGPIVDDVTRLLLEDGLASGDLYVAPGSPGELYIPFDGASGGLRAGGLQAAEESVIARYILDPQTYEAPSNFARGLMVAFKDAGPSGGLLANAAASVIKGALAMLAPAPSGAAKVIDMASRLAARTHKREPSVEEAIHGMEDELGVTNILSKAQEVIENVISGRWKMSDVRELYEMLRTDGPGRKYLRHWMTGAIIPSPAGLLVFLRKMKEYTQNDLDTMGAIVKLVEDRVVSHVQALGTLEVIADHFVADGRETEILQLSPESLSHHHDVPSIERPIVNLPTKLRAIIEGVRERGTGDANLVIGLTGEFANIAGGLPRYVAISLCDVIGRAAYSGGVAVVHRGALLTYAIFDPASQQSDPHESVRIARAKEMLQKTDAGRVFIEEMRRLFGSGNIGAVTKGDKRGAEQLTNVDLGDMLPLLEVVGDNYNDGKLRRFLLIAAATRRGDPPPHLVEATLRVIADHIGSTGRYPYFHVVIVEARSEKGLRVTEEIQRLMRGRGMAAKDLVISLPNQEITDLSPADAERAIGEIGRHGRIWLVSGGQIILDIPPTLSAIPK